MASCPGVFAEAAAEAVCTNASMGAARRRRRDHRKRVHSQAEPGLHADEIVRRTGATRDANRDRQESALSAVARSASAELVKRARAVRFLVAVVVAQPIFACAEHW